MNSYLLAVIAMFFWGIAPIFGKLGVNDVQPLTALTLRSVIISVLLLGTITCLGQWGELLSVKLETVKYIGMEGLCAALLGQLAYYYALKLGEVSQISPIVAAFPLVALVLGIVFLGEKITVYKIIAALLITLGIILLKY